MGKRVSKNILRHILTHCMSKAVSESVTNRCRVSNYDHYSYIVSDNEIVEWGRNKTKLVPPVHWGYNEHQGIHSELSAYLKAAGILRGREFGVVNVRLSPSLELKDSKPCKNCENLLRALGAGWVVYSTEDGFRKMGL